MPLHGTTRGISRSAATDSRLRPADTCVDALCRRQSTNVPQIRGCTTRPIRKEVLVERSVSLGARYRPLNFEAWNIAWQLVIYRPRLVRQLTKRLRVVEQVIRPTG